MNVDDEPSTLQRLTPTTRRQLQQEAERRTLEAAQQLLRREDIKQAAHNLAWVAQARKILQQSERPPSRLLFAAGIAMLCMVLAGLAVGINAPSNALRMNVNTHSLSFAISERSGDWQGKHLSLNGTGLSLENVQAIALSGEQYQAGPYTLDLYEADYYLSDLHISAGTWVDVDLDREILSLSFKQGTVSGTLRVKKAELVLSGKEDEQEQSIDEMTGEVLTFRSASLSELPLVLKIDQVHTSRSISLQATQLQFLRPDVPSSVRWVSTILQGDLTLLLNERQTELLEGDLVLFDSFESERLVITPHADNTLHITAEGQSDGIRAGPQGYEKNLTPTLLEYLYYQQQLTLFWSAVLFLWGLFWSLRNLW